MKQEQTPYHGAIRHSNLRHRIRRALRPKFHKSNLAGGAFDWTKGYDAGEMVIKDQGPSFSCGGQAAAYWRENQIRLLTGKYVPLSAKSVYSQIAYPGGGTTAAAISNIVCNVGMNTETNVPSMQNGLPPTEPFMTDRSWKAPWLIADALTRAGLVKVTVPISSDGIAQAMVQSGGTIWQIDAENGHGWLGTDPTPRTNNGQEKWSHFMMQKQALLRNSRQTIKCPQSWGVSVGERGYQYFTDDIIQSDVIDVWTYLPKSAFTPTGTPVQWLLSIFQRLLGFFSFSK